MRRRQSRRWAWRAAALAAVLFSAPACGMGRAGTLDPGGVGPGTFVNSVPRPADGRDVALSMSMMFNESDEESQADTVTLIDAKLIGSVGLELVDAFTVSTDAQIAVGKAVPPSDQDFEGDPEFSREQVENWAMRKPLAGSVILAEGVLQLVLVLRPTSEDTCLFAPGFNLRYEEFGRTYSVDSGLGMVVYRGEDPDICDSAVDEIRNNPVYR